MANVEVDNLNEKSLENAVVQFGEEILDRLNSAEDFVIEQAPLFVQEYLDYYFYYNVSGFFVTAVILVVACYTLLTCCKVLNTKENGLDKQVCLGVTIIISGILTLPLSVACYSYFVSIIKVCVAPRVVLVELIRSMI